MQFCYNFILILLFKYSVFSDNIYLVNAQCTMPNCSYFQNIQSIFQLYDFVNVNSTFLIKPYEFGTIWGWSCTVNF